MRHAVMAVDPGQTSGVACLILTQYPNTTNQDPITHLNLFEFPSPPQRKDKDYLAQYTPPAFDLYGLWMRFRVDAFQRLNIPPEDHKIVFEDFLPGPKITTGGRKAMSPVYIMSLFEGIRSAEARWYEHLGFGPADKPRIIYQQPAAKSLVDNDRLRTAGLYTITTGQPHARDALRHGLIYAARLGYARVHKGRKRTPPLRPLA